MTNKTSALRFVYRNYRGSVSERTVLPEKISYETDTPHHPNAGWVMTAWCLDRNDRRMFVITDILSPMVEVPYEQPTA